MTGLKKEDHIYYKLSSIIMKKKVFVAILLSAMFASSVLAQTPFRSTLDRLPGEQRPRNLTNVIGYIQFIPYFWWILRNPILWAYCLSILPTFISEIPTFFSYLHYYILQTPSALNQLFRLITNSIDRWLNTLLDDFFYVFTNLLSMPIKFIFEQFFTILQNSAATFYEFFVVLPYLASSFEKLLKISPEMMISSTPSIVGALSVVLPQFVPLSCSLVSYIIDWCNIFIEAIPRLVVNLVFNSVLMPLQWAYDILYSVVYILSFVLLKFPRSIIGLIMWLPQILPRLPEIPSRLSEIWQNLVTLSETSDIVNMIPNFMVGVSIFVTALITSLLASIPTILLNSLYSFFAAMPIVMSTSAKVVGSFLFLPIKGFGAVIFGIPAYFLSKISFFIFITLPKALFHLLVSSIKLCITGLSIVLGRGLGLPFIILYRILSLPYNIIAWLSSWIRSLLDPFVQYVIRILSLKFASP